MKPIIRIKKRALCRAISHCQASLPNEACGFFSGRREEGGLTIDRFHPVPNSSVTPENRFWMQPEEMIRTLYDVQHNGGVIAGILHSHPAEGTAPSAADAELYWPDLPSYWIVSLSNPRNPTYAAYRPARETNRPFEKLDVNIVL